LLLERTASQFYGTVVELNEFFGHGLISRSGEYDHTASQTKSGCANQENSPRKPVIHEEGSVAGKPPAP
jgi:hypothetical protein